MPWNRRWAILQCREIADELSFCVMKPQIILLFSEIAGINVSLLLIKRHLLCERFCSWVDQTWENFESVHFDNENFWNWRCICLVLCMDPENMHFISFSTVLLIYTKYPLLTFLFFFWSELKKFWTFSVFVSFDIEALLSKNIYNRWQPYALYFLSRICYILARNIFRIREGIRIVNSKILM